MTCAPPRFAQCFSSSHLLIVRPNIRLLDVYIRMEESGCWWGAERCDRVATHLIRLRRDLSGEYDDEVTALLAGVESISRILRDAHDLFPFYRPRVPLVLYYLTVVLPCLRRTLRDMMIYISHDELLPCRKLILMSERLSDQGGMSLASRFVM
jgi:hypothetical protein